jgi:Tol biopolymer transport system component
MSLSADETRLAHAQTSTGSMPQIWILDLVRGVDERFSFAPDGGNSPVWSPDGQWVAFNASIQGSTAIYLKDAGKGNSERLLLRSPESKHVQDWSRDGRFLVYVSSSLQTGRMEVLAIADPLTEGEHKPITIVASPQFNHSSAQVSPDSRWMAWVSGESGKGEVYVRPFPPSDGRSGQWQVSTAGGGMPRWRADGKELFYIAADSKLMAVDITTGTAFQSGVPHALFVTPIVPTMGVFRYAVTRDGKRFLMAVPAVQTAQPPVHIVVNWEAGLRK